MTNQAAPTIQTALAALLNALGYTAMAEEALTVTDPAIIARLARGIVKKSPPSMRAQLERNFGLLGVEGFVAPRACFRA